MVLPKFQAWVIQVLLYWYFDKTFYMELINLAMCFMYSHQPAWFPNATASCTSSDNIYKHINNQGYIVG